MGQPDIHVHPWGGIRKKTPVTKNGGMFRVWLPTGDELIDRIGAKFYSPKLDFSGGFLVSENRKLFEGMYLTSYDISPDGEKLLMVKDKNGTLPKQLNIILNWTRESDQLMNEAN